MWKDHTVQRLLVLVGLALRLGLLDAADVVGVGLVRVVRGASAAIVVLLVIVVVRGLALAARAARGAVAAAVGRPRVLRQALDVLGARLALLQVAQVRAGLGRRERVGGRKRGREGGREGERS